MTTRPAILVTNDDGVTSPGLIALAGALAELGDVTVVAPDSDRSGAGHALSFGASIEVAAVPDRAVTTYRCSGTPSDCVVVGASGSCGPVPALVVSGINRGANVGDDVNYSGTVAAAFQAAVLGLPSIAISLAARGSEGTGSERHWSTAERIALRVAANVLETGLPRLTLLNVNVPNVAMKKLRGIRWVRQARKAHRERAEPREEAPGGAKYFVLSAAYDASAVVEGTDVAAVQDGYVSVTPITVDRTDHEELGRRIRAEREPRPDI